MSGSTSGVWRRSHGRTSEAPPNERGGSRYVRPKATAPHLDSTEPSDLMHGWRTAARPPPGRSIASPLFPLPTIGTPLKRLATGLGIRHVAFSHLQLGLAGMGPGQNRGRSQWRDQPPRPRRVEGQRQIAALNVGVPRGDGDSGQGQVVSVR